MKKVLLFIISVFSLSAYSQVFTSGFETNNGPITNWTLYNVDALTPATNVAFVNNAWVASGEEFNNNVAISTSWYTPAGTSNDWIVSPAITLPSGTNTLYWHARSYDATYKESYKVYISTTGNAVANFTTPLLTVNNEDVTWQNKSLDLSAYSGQTIYLAFQNFSNDMFLGAIDNVYIANGTVPQISRVIDYSGITKTNATITWTPPTSGVTGYDYSIGAVNAAPTVMGSTTSSTATATNLTENTRYHYYVRSKNGTLNSAWIGPYSLYTATELGIGSYSYGFDNTTSGFYQNDGWTGAWSTNASATNAQAGGQMIFSNSSTTVGTPTNRWIFSKPFNLTAGNVYNITFYLRSFGTTANAQSIALKVGNDDTTTAQTNTLWSSTTFASGTWTQFNTSFTPTTSGTYYFSFQHYTPGVAGGVSLGLDTFNINGVLSTSEVNIDNTLAISPNPTSDVLNIKTKGKVKAITIYDMSGRKINAQVIDSKVDVKNFQSGTYLIDIETSLGKSSQKFIKK